ALLLAAERAGTEGYTRGLTEAYAEGAAALAEMKENIANLDRLMAGDQKMLRSNLLKFVNAYLPPKERGAFIGRITAVLQRPLLRGGRGTTEGMFNRMWDVMDAIDARAKQVYRDELIRDMRRIVKRATKSPSVDLAAKGILNRMMDGIALRNITNATRGRLEKIRDYIAKQQALGLDTTVPERLLRAIARLGDRPGSHMPTAPRGASHHKLWLPR